MSTFSLSSRISLDRTPAPSGPAPWLATLIRKSREQAWKVEDLDLDSDRALFKKLDARQQAVVLRTLSRFLHGESRVEMNLAPLICLKQRQGREDEAKYIERFQIEEGIHTKFFTQYFIRAINQEPPKVIDSYSAPFLKLFDGHLGQVLTELRRSDNWRHEVRALVTYMLVCEGTIASLAYYGFSKALTLSDGRELLPSLLAGLRHTQRDEARHIAYGVNSLNCLVQEHGIPAAVEVIAQLTKLAPSTFGCVGMAHREFDPFPFPWIDRGALKSYARQQFFGRVRHVLGPVWGRRAEGQASRQSGSSYIS